MNNNVEILSTKTYTHAQGLSCVFRQWRAESHCNQPHGYALQVKIVFGAYGPDKNGWVQDFGGLKGVKQMLEQAFDHTWLVANDDPLKDYFLALREKGINNIIIVSAVGCEAFARMIFDNVNRLVQQDSQGRVRVEEVEVREHEANSAICRRK